MPSSTVPPNQESPPARFPFTSPMNFPSSVWTVLLEARRDPEKVKDVVVRRYREPVYEYMRRQGMRHEDAEDLAQEVFVRICAEDFLKRVDPRKGRFRALLLTISRHVLASFRRKELSAARDRRREVALEDFDVPTEIEPDAEFDRLWVRHLVAQALENLNSEAAGAALRLQMQGKSYQEIARALSKSETEVTNYIHRGKKRLRQEIERLIAEYANRDETPGEVESLLQYL